MTTNPPSRSATQQQRTTYISSNGQPLATPPLNARLTRSASNIYNFLGLYVVSLFSLDPYTAAQTSRFNTRGPGRATGSGTTAAAPRWGAGGGTGSTNTRGPGGGGPGAGSGSGGRRLGTVDDVRGPECGSCG